MEDGAWIDRGVEKGLGMESVSLSAVEADHSDDLWVWVAGWDDVKESTIWEWDFQGFHNSVIYG